MAEHSEETLELLERRLADRVTERVRPALFRLYAVAGSAVITALGLFGWSIVADIKDRARSRAEQSVQQAISPLITTATEKIRDSSTKIDAQLAVMEWLGQRARVLTEKVDAQLRDFTPKTQILDDITKKVDDLERKRRDLEEAIERTRIAATGIVPVAQQVEILAQQVKALSEQATLSAPQTERPGIQQEYPKIAAQAQNVAESTQQARQQVEAVAARPTVWFQFAGAPRPQAQDFSRALVKKGYIVPGEDREPGAAGKREVRYFYPEDKPLATRLATDAVDALQELGYNPPPQVAVKSLVEYEGKKPRPSTLELWLELPAR